MDSSNFYKANTHFAVVKTASLNVYKVNTPLAVVKTDSSNFYKPILHALRKSRRDRLSSHSSMRLRHKTSIVLNSVYTMQHIKAKETM